ncbi:MAG: phage tail tape measure protein, partial [bacterium]
MSAKAEIEISARGGAGVARELGRVGGALGQVQGKARAATSMVRGLYGALGGVGLMAGAKRVLDFRSIIGQLQADMGISTEAARALEQQVLSTSQAYGVAKAEVAGALQVFQDFGGIVDKGSTILDGLTKVAKASGTPVKELATIASTLMQTLGMSPDEALASITQFNDQALKGQVSMRKLAGIIPGVMGAGVGKGFAGGRAVTQLGTLLQVAGQATGGNAEEARTQALALMRDLAKAAPKLKKQFKIDVLDKDKNLRDLDVLMAEIAKATKGTMLDKKSAIIFTEESAKVAGIFRSMFDVTTGKYKAGSTVENVLGAKGGMGAIDEQYNRRVEGIDKEGQKLQSTITELDAGLMKYGSSVLEWINANTATAVTGAVAGGLAWKLGGSVVGA